MGLLLKQLFQFIKLLNSDTGQNQIAAGLACGIILGFSPILSLQTLVVFLLIFIFRIQLGAAFVSAFFFKFVAFLIDPLSDALGQKILESSALVPLFTQMYNMPIVPLTRFNNSIVMGSGVIAICLAPIAFIVFRILIAKYRHYVLARFEGTRFWKAVKATSVYKWYHTYDKLYG